MIRCVGFIFIIIGATATGFGIAFSVQRQCIFYRQLIGVLEFMKAEIEFRLTPLGEIYAQIGEGEAHFLRGIFLKMKAAQLQSPGRPAGVTMRRILQNCGTNIPKEGKCILMELFDVLGRQDVMAQIRALDYAEKRTQMALETIEKEKTNRCRTYRTIGICAGLALAVILV